MLPAAWIATRTVAAETIERDDMDHGKVYGKFFMVQGNLYFNRFANYQIDNSATTSRGNPCPRTGVVVARQILGRDKPCPYKNNLGKGISILNRLNAYG